MATTRKTWPGDVGEGRKTYPWDQWLDGQIWLLRRGVDYTCTTTAMRAQYGMRCNAGHIAYRTHQTSDGDGLYVQAFPNGR